MKNETPNNHSTATDTKPPNVSGSAYLMEIYDNSRPKEPKMIAAMEYPSKEAEKIKNKIDKGGTQYTYKLVYWHCR